MAEYNFSPHQIAEMAMSVEEAGVIFYERLATLVDDPKLKQIFTTLSKAELGHRDTFRGIADSSLKDGLSEYSVDLSLLMKNHIDKLKEAAFNMRSFSNKPTTIQEALSIAIHIEQEAIRIYTEMRNTFIERFHEVLSGIIEEEKKHSEILHDIKTRLDYNSDIR